MRCSCVSLVHCLGYTGREETRTVLPTEIGEKKHLVCSKSSSQIVLALRHSSYFNLLIVSCLFAFGSSPLQIAPSQLLRTSFQPLNFHGLFFRLKNSTFQRGRKYLAFVGPV